MPIVIFRAMLVANEITESKNPTIPCRFLAIVAFLFVERQSRRMAMKKSIVIAAIGMCVCLNAQSKRVVCDGNSCRIEPVDQTVSNKTASAGKEGCYAVVSDRKSVV